jgi:transposase
LIARASRAQKKGLSIDPPGFDAGKEIKGKKRHVLVDTQGLLLHAIVHAADIQDRDGGVLLMSAVFGTFPFLLKLYADSGYQGPKFEDGLLTVFRQINVEIVRRSDCSKFVVLPKRWIVERTIAWLNRCRRLAKDWECLNRNGLAFLRWASIRLMLRKLSQPRYDPGWALTLFRIDVAMKDRPSASAELSGFHVRAIITSNLEDDG